MRGADEQPGSMFSCVFLEERVPADHPLRAVRRITDQALKLLSPRFGRMYVNFGRPSIPPERLLRALLLQALYTCEHAGSTAMPSGMTIPTRDHMKGKHRMPSRHEILARVIAPLFLLGVAVPWQAQAQDRAVPADATLTFDVASVKPHKTGDRRVSVVSEPNGRFTMNNVPAQLMLVIAYQLQPYQIVGAPSWLQSERYDLIAKAPDGRSAASGGTAGPGPLQFMLRNMLADRFKLKVHTEIREMPIYALVLSRGDGKLGPKLQPSTVECGAPGRGGGAASPSGGLSLENLPSCSILATAASVGGKGLPLTELASNLSQRVGRTVVDRTGLTGRYDFLVEYTPDPPAGAAPPGGPPADPDRPSIYAALQEQLGLKLDAQRGAVDVIVVDAIERPTED